MTTSNQPWQPLKSAGMMAITTTICMDHFQLLLTCPVLAVTTHCKKSPIYVFPEKELCGLSPNFHIHVSVSDLYFPMDRSIYFPAAE